MNDWIKTSDKKPILRRRSKYTNCASSSFVLGAFREDGEWYCEVTKFIRGGQGDDSTLHWWTDEEPLYWMPLPKMPKMMRK